MTLIIQPNNKVKKKVFRFSWNDKPWHAFSGLYKEVLQPIHHSSVESWYNCVADSSSRTLFKSVFKGIFSAQNLHEDPKHPLFQVSRVAVNVYGHLLLAARFLGCTTAWLCRFPDKRESFMEVFTSIVRYVRSTASSYSEEFPHPLPSNTALLLPKRALGIREGFPRPECATVNLDLEKNVNDEEDFEELFASLHAKNRAESEKCKRDLLLDKSTSKDYLQLSTMTTSKEHFTRQFHKKKLPVEFKGAPKFFALGHCGRRHVESTCPYGGCVVRDVKEDALDALAKQATVFEDSCLTSPITLKTAGSLNYVTTNKAMFNCGDSAAFQAAKSKKTRQDLSSMLKTNSSRIPWGQQSEDFVPLSFSTTYRDTICSHP